MYKNEAEIKCGVGIFSRDYDLAEPKDLDILLKSDGKVRDIFGLDDILDVISRSAPVSIPFDHFKNVNYFDNDLNDDVLAQYFVGFIDSSKKEDVAKALDGEWWNFDSFDDYRSFLDPFALKFCQEYYKHISKPNYISKERLEKYSGYPKKV